MIFFHVFLHLATQLKHKTYYLEVVILSAAIKLLSSNINNCKILIIWKFLSQRLQFTVFPSCLILRQSLSSWFGRTSAPGQTQTGLGQRVILLLPQAVLPGSDAGSDVVNQHQISSFKTVRPRIPCGTRCMGHVVRSWFAVCSMAPHSKFGKKARPHLCMDEWNRPTPVRR